MIELIRVKSIISLMFKDKNFRAGYKLFFGLLGFSAVVTEIAVLTERGVFDAANFFSYFTIQTNILAAVMLFAAAGMTFAGKKSGRFEDWRGAVTLYILIVGIGFAILLSGLEGVRFTAIAWDNIVLHYIMPAAVLADWVVDPPRRKIKFTRIVPWMGFPAAYMVYTLARGAATGWYPYPFLNPRADGYAGVAAGVSGIAALALALGWVIVRLSVRRNN